MKWSNSYYCFHSKPPILLDTVLANRFIILQYTFSRNLLLNNRCFGITQQYENFRHFSRLNCLPFSLMIVSAFSLTLSIFSFIRMDMLEATESFYFICSFTFRTIHKNIVIFCHHWELNDKTLYHPKIEILHSQMDNLFQLERNFSFINKNDADNSWVIWIFEWGLKL